MLRDLQVFQKNDSLDPWPQEYLDDPKKAGMAEKLVCLTFTSCSSEVIAFDDRFWLGFGQSVETVMNSLFYDKGAYKVSLYFRNLMGNYPRFRVFCLQHLRAPQIISMDDSAYAGSWFPNQRHILLNCEYDITRKRPANLDRQKSSGRWKGPCAIMVDHDTCAGSPAKEVQHRGL